MNSNNYNFNNQNYGNNPSCGWAQPAYPGYMSQPQLNTNVMLVTGLEEALIKTNSRNSDMVYFDQDRNVFYRIKVDMEGKKSWAEFPYNVPGQEDNTAATKADIRALLARIEALENAKIPTTSPKKKKEVVDSAESDG